MKPCNLWLNGSYYGVSALGTVERISQEHLSHNEFHPCDSHETILVLEEVARIRKNQKARKRRVARQEKDQAMRDCGLTKVKGSQGGTFWE